MQNSADEIARPISAPNLDPARPVTRERVRRLAVRGDAYRLLHGFSTPASTESFAGHPGRGPPPTRVGTGPVRSSLGVRRTIRCADLARKRPRTPSNPRGRPFHENPIRGARFQRKRQGLCV